MSPPAVDWFAGIRSVKFGEDFVCNPETDLCCLPVYLKVFLFSFFPFFYFSATTHVHLLIASAPRLPQSVESFLSVAMPADKTPELQFRYLFR